MKCRIWNKNGPFNCIAKISCLCLQLQNSLFSRSLRLSKTEGFSEPIFLQQHCKHFADSNSNNNLFLVIDISVVLYHVVPSAPTCVPRTTRPSPWTLRDHHTTTNPISRYATLCCFWMQWKCEYDLVPLQDSLFSKSSSGLYILFLISLFRSSSKSEKLNTLIYKGSIKYQ